MAEQADARDLKSLEGFLVRVRLPLPAQGRIDDKDTAGWSNQEARRAHNPEVAGSNPAPATSKGGVAQLARAFGSYPKGSGFESLRR
jgi:hypothetical protein